MYVSPLNCLRHQGARISDSAYQLRTSLRFLRDERAVMLVGVAGQHWPCQSISVKLALVEQAVVGDRYARCNTIVTRDYER
jgi:hypothetical protein